MPEEITAVKKMADKLRSKLTSADFEMRRLLIDQLNLRVKLRRDEEDNRWLDVSCGIAAEPESLLITSSHCQVNGWQKRCSETTWAEGVRADGLGNPGSLRGSADGFLDAAFVQVVAAQ